MLRLLPRRPIPRRAPRLGLGLARARQPRVARGGSCPLTAAARRSMYVDAHCHLTHRMFEGRGDEVARAAAAAGVSRVCVNGLDPQSNTDVLALCARHANLVPAAGIHPLHAACGVYDTAEAWAAAVPGTPMPARFDVAAELARLRRWAGEGRLAAIGECGLDAFYYKDAALLREQEHVLEELCAIAVEHDLPVILHSRKREARVFELIQASGVARAVFHCFTGKHKLAKRIAAAGYYVSISATVMRVAELQRLATVVPLDRILTETDAPFLAPVKGEINEPLNVVASCVAIAEARGEAVEDVVRQVRQNFDVCVPAAERFLREGEGLGMVTAVDQA